MGRCVLRCSPLKESKLERQVCNREGHTGKNDSHRAGPEGQSSGTLEAMRVKRVAFVVVAVAATGFGLAAHAQNQRRPT
jgi:hypothetical protein